MDRALRRKDPTAAVLLARKVELAPLAEALGCVGEADAVAAAYQEVANQNDPVLHAIQTVRGWSPPTGGDALTAAVLLLHPGTIDGDPLSPGELFDRYPAAGADNLSRIGVLAAHLRLVVFTRMTRRLHRDAVKDTHHMASSQETQSFTIFGFGPPRTIFGYQLFGVRSDSKPPESYVDVAPVSEPPLDIVDIKAQPAELEVTSAEEPASLAPEEQGPGFFGRLRDAIRSWVGRRGDDIDYAYDRVRNVSLAGSLLDLDELLKHFATDDLEQEAEREVRAIEKFNILIAGGSGVGKSTLINSIFSADLAASGMGKPITPDTAAYEAEGVPFRLWDTAGWEMQAYARTMEAVRRHIETTKQATGAEEHLHVIWLCIAEPATKVEDAHISLCALAQEHSIPVIAVLTKCGAHPEFEAVVRELLPTVKDVVRVRALKTIMEGHVFPSKGLDFLVNATRRVLPEGVKAAFDAVQTLQLDARFRNADRIPFKFAAMAGSAAAVPIPIASAAAILPVQFKMIAAINAALGIPVSTNHWRPLVLAILGGLGATALGRLLVVSLLDVVPGINFAAEAISAAMSSAITLGLGHAYIAFIQKFYLENKRMPDADDIVAGFRDFWAKYEATQQSPSMPDA